MVTPYSQEAYIGNGVLNREINKAAGTSYFTPIMLDVKSHRLLTAV